MLDQLPELRRDHAAADVAEIKRPTSYALVVKGDRDHTWLP